MSRGKKQWQRSLQRQHSSEVLISNCVLRSACTNCVYMFYVLHARTFSGTERTHTCTVRACAIEACVSLKRFSSRSRTACGDQCTTAVHVACSRFAPFERFRSESALLFEHLHYIRPPDVFNESTHKQCIAMPSVAEEE